MALSRNHTGHRQSATAFTLVELLVTMVILSILAGLSLSGLAASRQRAKIDKTKSTIRKLHEIVMPQYESYLSRRVAATGAANRLAAVRLLMVQEMPDQWADVYAVASLPAGATAPTRRYAAYKATLSTGSQWTARGATYEGAECLAMIVTRGGFAPDATELFRTDEMGDIDGDGAPEFWDGWGRPIGYIRWPAGFSSFVQQQNAATNPDPLDPMKVSGDYALVPLIFSSGPNGATDDPMATKSGYQASVTGGYLSAVITTTCGGTPLVGSIIDTDAARDNITNHDLVTK